jgi:uncharacterized membrane protein (UPF0127 family)
MNKSRKIAYGVGLIAIIILVICYTVFHKKSSVPNENLPLTETISTPGGNIFVRVARTNNEQQMGLSGFKTIYENQGMLFPFKNSGIYPFWMKDMNFPLDMVWLKHIPKSPYLPQVGDYYQVVMVTENALPSSYPKMFQTTTPVDAVLEINAFAASKFGLTVGTGIHLIHAISSREPVLNP